MKRAGAVALSILVLATGTPVHAQSFRHTAAVTAVAFFPDGSSAISASADGTILIWDLSFGDPSPMKAHRRLIGHSEVVTSISLSPDGRYCLSGSVERAKNKTLILWETKSGQEVATFRGHSEGVASVAFCPDGRCALSGGFDRKLILWEIPSGKPRHTIVRRYPIPALAFSPDGRHVAVGLMYVINLFTFPAWETPISVFRYGHSMSVTTLAFSPDGKFVLTGSLDKSLALWDVSQSVVVAEPVRKFVGHDNTIHAVVFLSEGRHALSSSGDGTLGLWDVPSGNLLRRIRVPGARPSSLAVSPDGRHVLAGTDTGAMGLWSVREILEHVRE